MSEPEAQAQNEHRFRVIYGDTDQMGVVYYANYLRFFEAGRSELMRAYGLTYREFESMGFLLPVVNANVRYHAPARYDELLVLLTRVVAIRHASLQIDYRLTRVEDQVLLATGETTHACLAEGRVARIPEPFRARFESGGKTA